MKKNKILIALGIIGSLSIANAQFAVTNVNDNLIWGPTGYQTKMFGALNTVLDGNMQAQNETQRIMIAQQNGNMAVQDSRQRRTIGLAEIAKQDDALRPTIAQCVEVTANTYKYGAVSNIFNGGRRSGNKSPAGAPFSYDDAALAITNSAANQVLMLKTMKDLGTCSPEYGNAANCGGSVGEYAKADTTSLSIKANMKGAATGRDYANWSLDAKGIEVGKKYIKDATLNQAPRFPSKEQLEKNPGYLTTYNGIITKLKAAQDALTDILNFTSGTQLIGTPLAIWNAGKADYQSIFGSAPPTNPSSFEVINFTVYKDYMIPKTGQTDLELNQDRNRLLAVNNYLLLQQFKTQQNTNILLSHLLVQTTTPMNKDAADAEYNKTVALK